MTLGKGINMADVIWTVLMFGTVAVLLVAWAWRRRNPEQRALRLDEEVARMEAREAREKAVKTRSVEKAEIKRVADRNRAKHQLARGAKKIDADITNIGARTPDGLLMCPRCGGTNFKTKRSGAVKGVAAAGVVVAGPLGLAALAKASQVKCVTCGTSYGRG